VVENGVDVDMFTPLDGSRVRDELGLGERLVITYAGTIGMAHGLSTVLEAAERLKTQLPGAQILLIGEGAQREQLEARARSRKLDNLRFLGPQPRVKIPEYLSASDVCLVLLRRDPLFKTVLPTKMLEFMACSRPIIAGVEGLTQELIDRSGAGLSIEPENVDQLVDAIMTLANNPQLRCEMGAAGRRFAVSEFSRRATAERYSSALQHMVQSNGTTR
jgi:glycosyltransferase involved in cell wall biosynthesis